MKKIRFIFAIVAVSSLAAFVFYGCKDKDKIAPLIFINGSNPYTTELEKPYNDSSAVAEDNLDGTLTASMIIGHNIPKKYVNGDSVTSKTGTYEVNYTATDKAGNQKVSTRTVYVKNWAWPYEVSYLVSRKKVGTVSDSVGCQYWKYYPYRTVQQRFNVTADKTTNKKITLPLGGEIKIKVAADFVDPTHIRIETQSVYGQYGWDGTTVRTDSVLYKVVGVSTGTTSDHAASYVENSTPGHLKLVIKYYISKHTTLSPTSPSGVNVLYTDTLNQRF